jgi:hypothetical protein
MSMNDERHYGMDTITKFNEALTTSSGLEISSESSELVEINIIEVPIYETIHKDEEHKTEWEESKESESQRKAIVGLFNILSRYLKPFLPESATLNKNKYGLIDANIDIDLDNLNSNFGSVYVPLKLSYPRKHSDLFSDEFINEICKFAAESLDNINKFSVVSENEPDMVKVLTSDEKNVSKIKGSDHKLLVVSSAEQKKIMNHAVSFLRKVKTDVSLECIISGKKKIVNIQKAKPSKSFENDELEPIQIEAYIINITCRINELSVTLDLIDKKSNMICKFHEEHLDDIFDIAKTRNKCYLTVRTNQKTTNGENINDYTAGKILGISTTPLNQEIFSF